MNQGLNCDASLNTEHLFFMINLQTCQGNILDFKADFIVNASNTTLKLGSGVSMVLKKACGPQLQTEMLKIREDIYKHNRLIELGEVFATKSFEHHNSQYVLHAAVVNYNPGVKQFEGKPSLETIKTILKNCIPYFDWFYTEYNRAPKIVFPYIGCGVGGLNPQNVEIVFEEFVKHYQYKVKVNILLVAYV
jgi:O-acetyl-ADP-ribose deacetylase (regulator of RNase III)